MQTSCAPCKFYRETREGVNILSEQTNGWGGKASKRGRAQRNERGVERERERERGREGKREGEREREVEREGRETGRKREREGGGREGWREDK